MSRKSHQAKIEGGNGGDDSDDNSFNGRLGDASNRESEKLPEVNISNKSKQKFKRVNQLGNALKNTLRRDAYRS